MGNSTKGSLYAYRYTRDVVKIYCSWLMYDEAQFNADSPAGISMYTWGEDYCQDMDEGINDLVSSLKYTGAPDGYK